MSARTKIEWTEATWNPIRGCSRVSEGCRHCYAERIAARFSGLGRPYEGLAKATPSGPRWTGDIRLVEKALDLPLRWREPRTVFVNSMSDLFHERVEPEWIDRIFAVMALAPRHTFQILTKRPDRMWRHLNDCMFKSRVEQDAWKLRPDDLPVGVAIPLPHVWLGVSAEDQATADARIPSLLRTPAAVRFVSAEPLLGPIDLTPYLTRELVSGDELPRPDYLRHHPEIRTPRVARLSTRLDWIIVGGESGPGARPMDPAWPCSIRDQCAEAGVAFFMKQMAAKAPIPRDLLVRRYPAARP